MTHRLNGARGGVFSVKGTVGEWAVIPRCHAFVDAAVVEGGGRPEDVEWRLPQLRPPNDRPSRGVEGVQTPVPSANPQGFLVADLADGGGTDDSNRPELER